MLDIHHPCTPHAAPCAVCKTFDQVAVPLLFDQIYMSDKQADVKIANLTVSRSGAYVCTLVLSNVYHISKTRLEISHDTCSMLGKSMKDCTQRNKKSPRVASALHSFATLQAKYKISAR